MKFIANKVGLFLASLILCISTAFADTNTDADIIFNWAEQTYPELFTPLSTTQLFDEWFYRYYSNTDNYTGVNNKGEVAVLGKEFGEGIQIVGTVKEFLNTINETVEVVGTFKVDHVDKFDVMHTQQSINCPVKIRSFQLNNMKNFDGSSEPKDVFVPMHYHADFRRIEGRVEDICLAHSYDYSFKWHYIVEKEAYTVTDALNGTVRKEWRYLYPDCELVTDKKLELEMESQGYHKDYVIYPDPLVSISGNVNIPGATEDEMDFCKDTNFNLPYIPTKQCFTNVEDDGFVSRKICVSGREMDYSIRYDRRSGSAKIKQIEYVVCEEMCEIPCGSSCSIEQDSLEFRINEYRSKVHVHQWYYDNTEEKNFDSLTSYFYYDSPIDLLKINEKFKLFPIDYLNLTGISIGESQMYSSGRVKLSILCSLKRDTQTISTFLDSDDVHGEHKSLSGCSISDIAVPNPPQI